MSLRCFAGAAALLAAFPAAAGPLVTITDGFAFDPPAVTIRAGETIEWRNASAFSHTVTDDPAKAGQAGDASLPPGAPPFSSGELHPGESFRQRLAVPGSYAYFCLPHEGVGMLGRITVLPAQ
jgi:plastocyanin